MSSVASLEPPKTPPLPQTPTTESHTTNKKLFQLKTTNTKHIHSKNFFNFTNTKHQTPSHTLLTPNDKQPSTDHQTYIPKNFFNTKHQTPSHTLLTPNDKQPSTDHQTYIPKNFSNFTNTKHRVTHY